MAGLKNYYEASLASHSCTFKLYIQHFQAQSRCIYTTFLSQKIKNFKVFISAIRYLLYETTNNKCMHGAGCKTMLIKLINIIKFKNFKT